MNTVIDGNVYKRVEGSTARDRAFPVSVSHPALGRRKRETPSDSNVCADPRVIPEVQVGGHQRVSPRPRSVMEPSAFPLVIVIGKAAFGIKLCGHAQLAGAAC